MSTSRRMWPKDMTVAGKGGFEKIKDADGVNRFIQGEITPDPLSTGLPDGMKCTYSHWSLSGSHLMAVLAGNFTADSVKKESSQVHGFDVYLPKTIYDKLHPLGDRNVVCVANVEWWDNIYNRNVIGTMEAQKYPQNNVLTIGALELNQDINSKGSSWRVLIDILIA